MDKMKLLMQIRQIANVNQVRKSMNSLPAFFNGTKRHCSDASKVDSGHSVPSFKHRTSIMDKRMLVWTKKFKTMHDVPDEVSREVMERAKSQSRIYVNLYMMGLTGVICIFMIWYGKHSAEKGESVHKMNLDWHDAYNKENKDEKK